MSDDLKNESPPQPLVPDDVDLQDFAFMPLDVRRLRDSDLASNETPEACWAAVLIWCASWHQVPAASVPNNQQWLAKVAGYLSRGRIDPEWEHIREGALRGWIECADGRLYHPVVAEKAIESWESKLRHSYGKMLERLRKANKQRAESGLDSIGTPTFIQWNSAGRMDPLPPEGEKPSAGIPLENALKGQGQGHIRDKKDSAGKPAVKSATLGVEFLVAQGVPEQAAKDWLAVRARKRAPLTESAWKAVAREARVANLTVGQAVQISAEKGWQGFESKWLGDRPINGSNPTGQPPAPVEKVRNVSELDL